MQIGIVSFFSMAVGCTRLNKDHVSHFAVAQWWRPNCDYKEHI